MGHMKNIAIELQEQEEQERDFDWQRELSKDLEENPELLDPHNEWGLLDPLDFICDDADEHPEWEIDEEMSREELEKIESDAEIFQLQHEGYWD